ncbi:MAG: peptidylprolyl isomerase [Cytophagaceae bacterium]|nr:peptidylprolyl isomerase [Cytophagaceae bacterium]
MAILNKIRSRGIYLVIIIALALFAFIFSSIITQGGAFDSKQNTIATVNGVDISREDFARKVELQSRNLGQGGSTMRAVNSVFEREVENAVLEEQYEELGIRVTKERLQELLKGALESNPTFQDADGFFSEAKLQDYINSVKNTEAFNAWLNFEQNLINTEKRAIYDNLVKAGVGATLKDGEVAYKLDGNTIDIQYVQVPYATIADADVEVTKGDIAAYINAHKEEFESDATRNIRFVKFEEKPTLEDENALKAELATLIKQTTYNGVTEPGLENVAEENIAELISEYSDLPYNDRFVFKNQLNAASRDTLYAMGAGAVYGPYKDGNYMKIDRVVAVKQLPDTATVRHILISTQGPEAMEQEKAKALADSLEKVVRRSPSKFEALAAQFSTDPGSKDKGGVYEDFPYGQMVPAFNDFSFEQAEGSIGTVETNYGFHVIEVLDQKNTQKVLKVATIAKEILPSEKTISQVYSVTQDFEIAARSGDFESIATEKGYTVKPVNSIKPLDETLPGEGAQRSIVTWAFDEESEVGDVKRFQVNDGYLVVELTKKTKEGLTSAEDAATLITPKVRKQKKAEMIKANITATELQEMANNQGQSVKTAGALNMSNPTIAGAGREPKVVGAAFALSEGQTSDLIEGDRGIYRVKVTKVTEAPSLDNYAVFTQQRTQAARNGVGPKVISALKKAADIEDNRATFY